MLEPKKSPIHPHLKRRGLLGQEDKKSSGTSQATIDRLWKIRREAYFVDWDKVKDDI